MNISDELIGQIVKVQPIVGLRRLRILGKHRGCSDNIEQVARSEENIFLGF